MGYNIFTGILEISLIGSILILLVLGIKKVLGSRLFPKAYLITWLIIFLRLLIPFQIEGGFTITDKITFFPLEQKSQTDNNNKTAMTYVPSGGQSTYEAENTKSYTPNTYNANENAVVGFDSAARQDDNDIVSKGRDIYKMLLFVWLMGFCIILTVMAVIYFKTYSRIL